MYVLLFTEECAAAIHMWTDPYTKNNYISLTLHYVNKDWNLVTRILCTCIFTEEKKTGENIRSEIIKKFCEMGFTRELFYKLTFVSDQGPNIVKALEGNKRLDCGALVINTI